LSGDFVKMQQGHKFKTQPMITNQIRTTIFEYNSETELEPVYQELIRQAKEATQSAYSPYSKFGVGASVLLENGQIIKGNNQENAAYPSGLCAERVALFYANSNLPDIKVSAIAIAAFTGGEYTKVPIPPCGSCRQVILETQTRYGLPIKVFMYSQEKILLVEDSSTLLPLSFQSKHLKGNTYI
jgi:cytidine deaminase